MNRPASIVFGIVLGVMTGWLLGAVKVSPLAPKGVITATLN